MYRKSQPFENEIHDRVLGKALTEEEQNNYTESLFESIKHINEYGEEFWYARELQIALDYKRWDKFQNVISKAMEACKNSENNVDDHFSHVGKIVEAGATYKLKKNSKNLWIKNRTAPVLPTPRR